MLSNTEAEMKLSIAYIKKRVYRKERKSKIGRKICLKGEIKPKLISEIGCHD